MKKIILILLYFAITVPIFSTVVLLKNGSNIRGKVNISIYKVDVEYANGTTETFNKKAILKIIFKDISDSEIATIRSQEESKLKEQLDKTVKLNRDMEQKIKDMQSRMKELQGNNEALKQLLAEIEGLKKKLKENEIKTMWGTVGRAAAFPGLGHFYLERKYFGWTYSTLFLSSFFLSIKNYGAYLSSKRKLESSSFSTYSLINVLGLVPSPQNQILNLLDVQQSQALANEHRAAVRGLNNSVFAMLGIYFIQLYHGYRLGKGVEFGDILLPSEEEELKKSSSFRWNYAPELAPYSQTGSEKTSLGWRFDASLVIRF